MNKKTKEIVFAAILTAISILITYSPVKLQLPFFTLTLGSHTPTMLAMLISPWVSVMTVIGSCIGFLMTIPAPNSVIVVARAITHLMFALIGCKMIKDNKINIYLVILITGVLHALTEGIAVFFITPLILPDQAILAATLIALSGTFVHHILDSLITIPIAVALIRAKIIHSKVKGDK